MISECICPHRPLHQGPGVAEPRKFRFEDTSTVIYPKLPDGKSIRVVIIRRRVISSTGAIVSVVKNAGKWNYKIQYPYKTKPTRMKENQFVNELKRMGAMSYLYLLFEKA
jgi:hypothetical protein